MKRLLVPSAAVLTLAALYYACSPGEDLEGVDSGSETLSAASDGVRFNIIPNLPPQNAQLIESSTSVDLLPLRTENQPYLDIRGAGDAAWTGNQQVTPPEAQFKRALDTFNGNGLLYRGDLSFINWESVVGTRCSSYGSGFGFLSSPESVAQAFSAGFNIFGLSNNHSRDCNSTPVAGSVGDGGGWEMSTTFHMNQLSTSQGLLWNGVARSGKNLVSVRSFSTAAGAVKVAFSSIDLGRDACTRSNCFGDRQGVLNALRTADADVRILSMHSREWLGGVSPVANRAQLDKLYATGKLAVETAGVDVVFGSGPHIAMPIRMFRKPDGQQGVVFLSLGNFIHPLLSAQSTSLIGRVLFDRGAGAPVQVQALMLSTSGGSATVRNFNPSDPFVAGLPWKVGKDPSTGISVGYLNLKR